MRKVFWLIALTLSLSATGWAACEEAADVLDRAQKKMGAAQSALNTASQRASQKADDDRRIIRDREDIINKRADLVSDPDYIMAQQEKMDAWKAWREAKEKLELCAQKAKESAW